jgi:hypothetical protein
MKENYFYSLSSFAKENKKLNKTFGFIVYLFENKIRLQFFSRALNLIFYCKHYFICEKKKEKSQ